MKYYKQGGKLIVCLLRKELESLLKEAKIDELHQILSTKDPSFIADFIAKGEGMETLADELTSNLTKDKDEVEIFSTVYLFNDFYPTDPEVCFYLKGSFNQKKDTINNLAELKSAVEEFSMTDFIFKTEEGFRLIQLKRYRGELTTAALLTFIKAKLDHYGRQLGSVNLLIVLQSTEADVSAIDFRVLHSEISKLKLTFPGEILISYNENNQFNVVNRVYPQLTSMRKPIKRS